jgi:hypothetical protein
LSSSSSSSSQVSGVTVDEALQDWPLDKAVVRLEGVFSRAGGFQRIMDHLVKTPREESILFFVDADMVAYPGLLNRVLRNTIRGHVRAVCGAAPCRVVSCCDVWCCEVMGVCLMYVAVDVCSRDLDDAGSSFPQPDVRVRRLLA